MNIWHKTLTLVAGALLLGACEGYVDKVDEIDPTVPTDASADQVLTSTEVAYIGFLEGDMARLAGMWSGYFSGIDRQYVTLYNYNAVSADFDAAWSNVFAGIVKNTRIVRQKAIAGGNRTQLGIAKIIEAHTLGMAAALWGDIPVDQAANVQQFPNPTYEPQAQVYTKVLALLAEGITDLQANVGPVSGDFLYGGNRANWIAAANTLRAKFLLHQGQFQQAITAATGGIRSASGNLLAPHGSSYGQNFNIYYSFLTYDRPGYMTADPSYAVQLLNPDDRAYRGNSKTDETGRLLYYFQQGLNTGSIEPNVLTSFDWGNAPEEDGFFGAATSFPLITFQENQLILAESHARLGQTQQALAALNVLRAYYDTGAHLNVAYRDLGSNYDPYVLADFQARGIENPTGNRSPEQALLREILEERYITFIGQLEGFNDVRRTNNALGVPVNQGNQIPRRFLYAQNEINANANAPRPVPDLFAPTTIFR